MDNFQFEVHFVLQNLVAHGESGVDGFGRMLADMRRMAALGVCDYWLIYRPSDGVILAQWDKDHIGGEK